MTQKNLIKKRDKMFPERESSALSQCDTSEFTEYLLFPGRLSPGEADAYNYPASDVSITTRAVSIKRVRVNSANT